MSQSESAASGEASAEQRDVSVLDILYCDNRRIGAFLSQFDELGVPTRVSVSESVQKARGRAFKFAVGGGIPGVGNANLNVERGPATMGAAESESREYDPLWANALALLDYLETNELIARNLQHARIGQFIQVGGPLAVMDLTLFKGIWSMPAMRAAVMAGQQMAEAQQGSHAPGLNRQQRRADQRRPSVADPAKDQAATLIDGVLSLVGMLPHAIQVRMAADDGSGAVVWASLQDSNMVVSAADLVLKHGVAVAGEWRMVGILDALPDEDPSGQMTQSGVDGLVRSMTVGDGAFGQMMLQMMPHLRPMMGRPFQAHGMTPLIIYRLIST